MRTTKPETKRKPPAASATRRAPARGKKKSSDVSLFSGAHINGFLVGVVTGAVASLGVITGINPNALPSAMSSQASATVESSPQPSFTFFSTLEDESFQIDLSSTADARTSMYTQYVLQAGSFRATEDADKRRGELALLGLESKIEEMKTDTGIWHRVYIGPFQSRSKMAKARSLTAQSDIDTLLLKRAQ